MKCPSCSAELVRAEGFPGGLCGSLVRVDCPLASCARPLVARVTGDDDMLVLMSEREGADAALAITGRTAISSRAIVFSLAIGAVVAIFLRPHDLSGAFLAVFAIAGAVAGLVTVIAVRRMRAQRDAARLLDAIAHVPRALEPVARGYR